MLWNLPISQLFPASAQGQIVHLHKYPLDPSIQVPPFKQGELEQYPLDMVVLAEVVTEVRDLTLGLSILVTLYDDLVVDGASLTDVALLFSLTDAI